MRKLPGRAKKARASRASSASSAAAVKGWRGKTGQETAEQLSAKCSRGSPCWRPSGRITSFSKAYNDNQRPPMLNWRLKKKRSLFKPAWLAGMPLSITLYIDSAL